MPIRLVDLLDGRSHEAGELEEANTGGDRERRERMAKRIGRPVLEARSADGGCPLVSPPFVEVQMAATSAGEEETGIESQGMIGERLSGSQGQRDGL